jgi:hypothetical protein
MSKIFATLLANIEKIGQREGVNLIDLLQLTRDTNCSKKPGEDDFVFPVKNNYRCVTRGDATTFSCSLTDNVSFDQFFFYLLMDDMYKKGLCVNGYDLDVKACVVAGWTGGISSESIRLIPEAGADFSFNDLFQNPDLITQIKESHACPQSPEDPTNFFMHCRTEKTDITVNKNRAWQPYITNALLQVIGMLASIQEHGYAMMFLQLKDLSIKICDDTMFNGKKLNETQMFQYKINGTTYAVPNMGFVVKIKPNAMFYGKFQFGEKVVEFLSDEELMTALISKVTSMFDFWSWDMEEAIGGEESGKNQSNMKLMSWLKFAVGETRFASFFSANPSFKDIQMWKIDEYKRSSMYISGFDLQFFFNQLSYIFDTSIKKLIAGTKASFADVYGGVDVDETSDKYETVFKKGQFESGVDVYLNPVLTDYQSIENTAYGKALGSIKLRDKHIPRQSIMSKNGFREFFRESYGDSFTLSNLPINAVLTSPAKFLQTSQFFNKQAMQMTTTFGNISRLPPWTKKVYDLDASTIIYGENMQKFVRSILSGDLTLKTYFTVTNECLFPPDTFLKGNQYWIAGGMKGQVFAINIIVQEKEGDQVLSIPAAIKKLPEIKHDELECPIYSDSEIRCYEDVNEIYVSAVASQVYNQGISPHFIQSYSVFTCKEENNSRIYYVMERIQGDLKSSAAMIAKLQRQLYLEKKPVPTYGEYLENILLQVIFGLYTFQTVLNGMHNDFHMGNVFLKYCDETPFNGTELNKTEFFTYNVGGNTYKLPNLGILAKLGDLGHASIKINKDDWTKPTRNIKSQLKYAKFTAPDAFNAIIKEQENALTGIAKTLGDMLKKVPGAGFVPSLVSKIVKTQKLRRLGVFNATNDLAVMFNNLSVHPDTYSVGLIQEYREMERKSQLRVYGNLDNFETFEINNQYFLPELLSPGLSTSTEFLSYAHAVTTPEYFITNSRSAQKYKVGSIQPASLPPRLPTDVPPPPTTTAAPEKMQATPSRQATRITSMVTGKPNF